MKITEKQICEDQIITFKQSHILLYQGLLFLTRSTCVIVDAWSHTCKSHFIPRYDMMVNSQFGAQLCIGYPIETVIFGPYMEYRYRNNAKMAYAGRYGRSKHWQGSNCHYWEWRLIWQTQTTCRFFNGTNWSPAANSGQRGPWSYSHDSADTLPPGGGGWVVLGGVLLQWRW